MYRSAEEEDVEEEEEEEEVKGLGGFFKRGVCADQKRMSES